jgi:protoheme IX farnesyltransferase
MERTGGRPIPSGRLNPFQALLIAFLFILTGATVLSQAGPLPVLLGLFNILLYNGLYTPLKPVTSFAVLPGGLVGAVPPMIGWTAAGGSPGHPVIFFVCTLMFLWQMPHFWLLTIRYWKEYESAGFKTLKRSLDDSQIRRLVFFWLALSLVFLLMAPLFGIRLKLWLFILMASLNVAFIVFFYIILFRRSSERMLKLIFILTNVFLTVVLIALILSSVL